MRSVTLDNTQFTAMAQAQERGHDDDYAAMSLKQMAEINDLIWFSDLFDDGRKAVVQSKTDLYSSDCYKMRVCKVVLTL